MQKLDLSILRFMRTRGHTPAVEKAAQLIARSGENGYLWFGIGLAGAALDAPRRKQWLASAAIGPAAIGLNFGILRRRLHYPVRTGSGSDWVSHTQSKAQIFNIREFLQPNPDI